jgi:hypothetical protein
MKKKLYNEEFYRLFSSLNISTIMKSRRMRNAGFVVGMRQEMHTKFWSENLKGKDTSSIDWA